MKRNEKILSVILLVILISGSFYLGIKYESFRQSEIEESFPMNHTGFSIYDLKTKALGKGDTIAYSNLTTEYLDFASEDFLPIALEMANEQNYPKAYFDVYNTITTMSNLSESDKIEKWEKLNPRMRRLAFEYLLIGAKLGHEQSIKTLKDCFVKGKPLSKVLYSNEDLVKGYFKLLKNIK